MRTCELPPEIQEVSSRAYDSSLDLTGVGGGPGLGNMGRVGVYVPEFSTTGQRNRYLIRLCGFHIPMGWDAYIHGLRQAATIRFIASVAHSIGNSSATDLLPRERQILDPFWQFVDGNISWHLRFLRRGYPVVHDIAQQPGTSPDMNGIDSKLIYTPPLFPYTAPNGGHPPGAPIGDWGEFYDLRFPWNSNDFQFKEWIAGPGTVVLYASVHQTCPTERPNPTDVVGLDDEDLFVSQFPTSAVYGRVAGSIIYQLVEQKCVPMRRSA